MSKILKQKFFERDTLIVAEDLIGKFLVRRIGEKEIAAMIVETEAYDGSHDKASHAHKGKTERTKVMFGPAGVFYIYLCYGMYYMLNVVTGPKGYPAAILIRSVFLQNGGHPMSTILDGPGKLTRALKIDKRLNALRASRETGLWFEDRGEKFKILRRRRIRLWRKNSKFKIAKMPRVGVSYAGTWAKKPYRFVLLNQNDF